MKTDIFQSCGHCWVFQICWHTECSTFTASSFRIWNSWTGMPSPPLALFVVMLSKAHLTSHSKMSGSRLVITSSWLSGSWRSFLYSPSVYSCHLFLILLLLLGPDHFCPLSSPYSQKTSQSNHTRTTALSNSMKPSHACGATQDRRVRVERSDRMWSTGEGNGKPLQYPALRTPWTVWKGNMIGHQKRNSPGY